MRVHNDLAVAMRCVWLALLFLALLPGAVSAQSTTVTASFIGNIVRTYSAESSVTGFDSFSGGSSDGESVGIAVRVARSLGDRWGVELEVALPAAVERNFSVSPLSGLETPFLSGTLVSGVPSSTVVPPILTRDIQASTESTYTTLNPALWFRQSLGSRTTLAYSAGPSFIRRNVDYERTTSLIVLPGSGEPSGLFPPSLTPFTSRDEYTDYGIGVAVGFEAEIRLTDRLAAVPGIRLQSAEGWIIRPGVGVSWRF